MIKGIKYFSNDVFYMMKKHYCPVCNILLKKVKVSRVVNSKSPEAKKFDFSAVDGWMYGNVKFIWKEFECPECKRHITVREMKEIEKKR